MGNRSFEKHIVAFHHPEEIATGVLGEHAS
jgi:hypothetical protein